MDNKGQVSIEVVLITGVAVLLIISVFNIWSTRMSLAREVGEAGEAKMTGELLAETINNVYANGVNFSITLTAEELNYTRLGDTQKIEGLGVVLPITIVEANKSIVISKNMSKTGLSEWNVSVSIIPTSILRLDNTTEFPETTVKYNGSTILIYASSSHIKVV